MSILAALRTRWDALVEGGQIDLRLEHALRDLVIDGGRVRGVAVEHRGQLVELRARSVVLTSGGYTANRELFRELTPGAPRLLTNAPASSSGDGLLAARRIGAGFSGAEHTQLSLLGGIAMGSVSIRADYFTSLVPAERAPREIHVNAAGERFCAEDHSSAAVREAAVARQHGHCFWIVFDARAIEGDPLVPGLDEAALRGLADAGGAIWVDEELYGLAGQAGVDPDSLLRTVEDWNAAVDRGHDPPGRTALVRIETPPFYAVRSNALFGVGFGGVTVDGELRVTTGDGEVIEGLFAAGEVIGVSRTMGNAVCSGMCLTPAMNFGRILGRRLAAVEAVEVGR